MYLIHVIPINSPLSSPNPIPGSREDIIIIAGIVAAGANPVPPMTAGRLAAPPAPAAPAPPAAAPPAAPPPVTTVCRTDTRGLMRLPREGKSGSGRGKRRGRGQGKDDGLTGWMDIVSIRYMYILPEYACCCRWDMTGV